MILQSKVRGPIALLATLALAVAPVWSQEEAGEEEEPKNRLSIEYEGWIMQPAGLDYVPATVSDPTVGVANDTISTGFENNRDDRWLVGFQLPNNMGLVEFGYQTVDFTTNDSDYRPGEYVFGESLAYTVQPFGVGAPGVNDDGLADGYLFSTATSLREYVISYGRDAFRTQRVEGRWSIGWRGTRQRRNQDATYYAMLSPLPPLLPPTADCTGNAQDVEDGVILNCSLSPQPDTAALGSTYDGRGPGARLEVDVNLWRDKLTLETGVGYTVQRGKTTANFIGTNNVYLCTATVIDPSTGEGCYEGQIVTYPWSQINQTIDVPGGDPIRVSDSVSQFSLSAGTQTLSQSAANEILDINLGLRWAILDWLELSGGWRSSYYSNAGLDIIPQDVAISVSGAVGIPSTRVKTASVTYEGFYAGVRFSFF